MSLFKNNKIQNEYLPTLSYDKNIDIPVLRRLDKKTLSKLCEIDYYVLDLCNEDEVLMRKMIAPDSLR